MDASLPLLFPVAQLITGTTPRGGGTWKYILHGLEQGLLRRNLPLMTQALHFKDYSSVTPKQLAKWQQKPLRVHYNGSLETPYKVIYQAPIFVDSGGFLFMWGQPPGLEAFGFAGKDAAKRIFEFSLNLVNQPGDRVTSLDYPIPLNLDEQAARSRLRKSLSNAVEAARILRERSHPAKLVAPVHGRSPSEAAEFASSLWRKLKREGLLPYLWGFGLGSMVPLRKAHRTNEIVAFVQAIRKAVPEAPLHVFGVTGLLVPFLYFEGATSFDSSGYVQKARSLKYITPEYKERQLQELPGEYPCDCLVCRERSLSTDLATLRDADAPKGAKSQVYAALALHNLEMDYRVLSESVNEGVGYLRELVTRHPRLAHLHDPSPPISLHPAQNDPEAFDWRNEQWQPQHSVLLLIPCSQEKPYTKSRSAKAVLNAVAGLPVDVVFLSGLYGPVPLEFVQHPAVMSYDFLLQRGDRMSLDRIRSRLTPLLKLYRHRVGYLAPPAYRDVAKGFPLELFPKHNKSRFSHFKRENLSQLRNFLEEICKKNICS